MAAILARLDHSTETRVAAQREGRQRDRRGASEPWDGGRRAVGRA